MIYAKARTFTQQKLNDVLDILCNLKTTKQTDKGNIQNYSVMEA